MIDGAEYYQDGRHAHYHVKVPDHEIGIRQRDIHGDVAQEQAGNAAVDECENESDYEQHRYRHMDVAAPQRQHPVIHFQGRRDRNDQRGRGEKETEIRIHAADVHMMRPDDERDDADGQNGPHHHAVTEDVFARMRGDEIRNHAKSRQGDNVHLRVAEEPEQVLEQDGAAPGVLRLLTHRQQRRHEETGSHHSVQQQHDAGNQQSRECEQAKDGGDEYAPYRQRHPHQGHAAATGLQHGGYVVEPAHGERHDEQHERNQHQYNPAPDAGGAR